MATLRESNVASRLRGAMRRHEVLAAGILSGVAGGIAMIVVVAIAASINGIPALDPLAVIGETFVGPEALDGIAVKVAFGAFVHAGTSSALGIVVAGILPRDFRTASAMGVGVGVALFAMGVMMSAVVPWANPGFRAASQAIGGSWVLAHAVFGMTLGTAPPLRRWISRDASDVRVRGEAVPTGAAAPASAAGPLPGDGAWHPEPGSPSSGPAVRSPGAQSSS